MKKLISSLLCLLLVGVILCGCAQEDVPDVDGRVREMVEALSAADVERGAALMHPSVAETAEQKVKGLSQFVRGRAVKQIEQESNERRKVEGDDGASQLVGTYRVVLEDDTAFEVQYTFLTNDAGEGFTTFFLSVR